jgi:hypothetical protein
LNDPPRQAEKSIAEYSVQRALEQQGEIPLAGLYVQVVWWLAFINLDWATPITTIPTIFVEIINPKYYLSRKIL